MVRYLVEVEVGKVELVQSGLKSLGIKPIRKVLNYISIDVPPDLVPKVESLPGVVRVVEERTYRVQVIPVEAKLQTFLRLGGPLSPAAIAWSLAMGLRKVRWPTSDSRKVLEADVADKLGINGRGVNVAVIDSGFDLLGCPQYLMPAYVDSTLEGDPIPLDNNGHGSHVFTTIAGSRIPTPWGFLEGVAKGVKIGSIKALGYGLGTARTVDVLEALMTAYANGAKVINMSLGSDVKPNERHDTKSCPLCSTVNMLSEKGMIFVIASGNSGRGYASCPGTAENAVTVAALKKDLSVAEFTSRNHPDYLDRRKPDVAAPGVDIGSSSTGLIAAMEFMDGPKTAFISGTSMASPHVSGVIALWVEYARKKGIELTYKEVKEVMSKYGSWSPETGYGIPKFTYIVDYLR